MVPGGRLLRIQAEADQHKAEWKNGELPWGGFPFLFTAENVKNEVKQSEDLPRSMVSFAFSAFSAVKPLVFLFCAERLPKRDLRMDRLKRHARPGRAESA
jgi:hypothetical protein